MLYRPFIRTMLMLLPEIPSRPAVVKAPGYAVPQLMCQVYSAVCFSVNYITIHSDVARYFPASDWMHIDPFSGMSNDMTGIFLSLATWYNWYYFPCLFLLLFRLLPKFDHLGEALYLIVHGIGDFTVAPKQSEFNIVVADTRAHPSGWARFLFRLATQRLEPQNSLQFFSR